MNIKEINKDTILTIEKSYKIIEPILVRNSRKYKIRHKYSLLFLLEYIERNINVLKSISFILNNESHLNSAEHSIGILLRSSLFDTATFIYIETEASKKNNIEYFDEFEVFVKKVFADHFNFPTSFIYQKKEEYFEFIEETDNGRIKSLYGRGFKANDLRRGFIEEEFYLKAIENWEWYSKYEHFGILSYELPRDSIVQNNRRQCFSILIILFGIVVTLNMLEDIEAGVLIEKQEKDEFNNCWHNYLSYLIENKIIDRI